MNILPNTTRVNKPSKMCPRLLKFYQIGEISPNLITLSAFSFPVKVGRYMAFLETIEVEPTWLFEASTSNWRYRNCENWFVKRTFIFDVESK